MATRAELVAAMRAQQREGYALGAIANAVRLQVGVFLALAQQASAGDPLRRPLRIGHEDYRAAFAEVTGMTTAALPQFISVPHRYGEDYLVDYRIDRVIDPATAPAGLRAALNVKAGWPEAPGTPASYSYEDRSTDPALEVTHERITAYRILDLGSAIVYDDIRGVTGRATSGLLGALFSVVGKAQAVQTRFAFAPDGTQVSRTTARKLLTLSQSVAIQPDGKVLPSVPEDRPDLQAIDQRLQRLTLNPVYRSMDLSPMPAAVEPVR